MKVKKPKVKCCICGDKHYPTNMNGIYRKTGHDYYCHKKNCQERLIEDAGDLQID